MNQFFIDENISLAKTIHSDFYNSQDIFSLSKEKIFSKSFQFIGDLDLFPDNGFAYPITFLESFLDEPLIILKDNNSNLKLVSNVCTHRGNILVNKPQNLNQIRCGYHGRTFNSNGEFQSMPEFEGVQNFPCKDDNLTELNIFKWGNLLFSSLNNDSDPLNFFGEMIDRMNFIQLDKLVRRDDLSKDYYIEANWALYCDNYLEGFHIPFVHNSLNNVLDFENYNNEIFYPYSNLQLGISKSKIGTFDLPKTSPDYGKFVAAYYFWVFPNMMFNFYPWGLSLNIVKPLAHNKTKISFITYTYDESLINIGAGVGLDTVELEDEAVVESVQKGVKSRFYNQGRFSIKREKCTHHFHTLLSKFLNS